MYTYEIKSRLNGIATVEFSNGETEVYTEQVTVSDAVFATEETPFIPPVYEIVEHTRPKVITETFTDNLGLDDAIQYRLNKLNGIVEVVPEPTPEEVERDTWLSQFQLLQKSKRAKKELEEVGLSFNAEEQTAFDELVAWVATNRKTEYVNYL